MRIRVGFELVYEFAESTPMVLMLNVHPSRAGDLLKPDQLQDFAAGSRHPLSRYVRQHLPPPVAPAGQIEISTDAIVADSGLPDEVNPTARQHDVGELPHEALVFLLASRYCETERLMHSRLVALRQDAGGLAARAGDLRLRAFARPLRLSACARRRAPPWTPSSSGAACAATSRTSRSRCAAA